MSSCLSEDWTVMVFPARSAKDQSYGTPALQDCSRATSIMESLNAASPPPGWGTSVGLALQVLGRPLTGLHRTFHVLK